MDTRGAPDSSSGCDTRHGDFVFEMGIYDKMEGLVMGLAIQSVASPLAAAVPTLQSRLVVVKVVVGLSLGGNTCVLRCI